MTYLEPENVRDLVDRDVAVGLGDFFTPTGGGPAHLGGLGVSDEPIASATQAAVPWELAARHDREMFAGIPPTGREVVIRGVTLVEEVEGETVFHRFVDWLSVLEQLGAVLVTRPAVESFPGDPAFRDEFGLLHSERSESEPDL